MAREEDSGEWRDVASSNLAAVRWRPDVGGQPVLSVRFKNGREYDYVGVPRHVWRALMDAPSHGEHHARHVKWVYPYRQVA